MNHTITPQEEQRYCGISEAIRRFLREKTTEEASADAYLVKASGSRVKVFFPACTDTGRILIGNGVTNTIFPLWGCFEAHPDVVVVGSPEEAEKVCAWYNWTHHEKSPKEVDSLILDAALMHVKTESGSTNLFKILFHGR